MKTSMLIKSLLSSLYETSGIVGSFIKHLSKNNYLMLMYHRVLPFKEAIPGMQAGMYVEPETFDMHLRYLNKYFRIIPFSEIFSYLKYTSYSKGDKPICIITFDDGWCDFYKYAFPILKAQSVSATVFLPTKYIGTEGQFWTDQLAYLIVQNRNKYNCSNPINKEHIENIDVTDTIDRLEGTINLRIEKAITLLKKCRDEDINVILEKLKRKWGVDPIPTERAFLKWGEVAEMKESGLINFGSHTHSHKMLTYLDDHEIMDELFQSKNKLILEKVVDTDFIPFSYPNGNYDERIINMVREAGYHAAATTETGWNYRNTPLFSLKRVAIHQDMSSTKEMFGCRICNLL
jgi:peptidoglycan/xylan/chitin deacetylase (PgdA/CDA1 family)